MLGVLFDLSDTDTMSSRKNANMQIPKMLNLLNKE